MKHKKQKKERSAKHIIKLLEVLNMFNGTKLTLNSDVDEDTKTGTRPDMTENADWDVKHQPFSLSDW